MKGGLQTISGTLRGHGVALLDRYDVENLHQLRVGLRRMRSFLKSRSGRRAGRLRHELGTLADTTNAARDWDTLVERARRELGPRQLKLFEDALCRYQAESRQPVLRMLRDPQWSEALACWDTYLEQHPRRHSGSGKRGKSAEQLRARVDRAWQRADQVGAPRNWHKLRIAIKDLRYRLEEGPRKARTGNQSGLLKQCKQVQGYLGDWHDTFVHLQLVHKMAQDCDPGEQSRELKILQKWCRTMENRGRYCLDATRAALRSETNAILPDTVTPDR